MDRDNLRLSNAQRRVLELLAAIPAGSYFHTSTINHKLATETSRWLRTTRGLPFPSWYGTLRILEDRGFVVRWQPSNGRELLWRLGPMSDALKEQGLL